eukprot:4861788-Prymnesium_polylepis.2
MAGLEGSLSMICALIGDGPPIGSGLPDLQAAGARRAPAPASRVRPQPPSSSVDRRPPPLSPAAPLLCRPPPPSSVARRPPPL